MNLEPLFARHRARLLKATVIPEVFTGRGLTLEQLGGYELGLDEDGNAVIALRDLTGRLLGLKVRLLDADTHKYLEIPSPNGNPPWFPPGSGLLSPHSCQGVLCVEGELNTLVTSLALARHGWAVVGLGSAFGPVPWDWLRALGVPVVFSLDPGHPGDKSVQGWLAQARAAHLSARRAEVLLRGRDACEYAELCGLDALGTRWAR